MAKELAKLYGCDSNKAYMAALAHDNAKDMKEEEVKKNLNLVMIW